MFLKQLYRHSKGLFLLFVLFVVAFIFLNVKWGLVATPVYQYGMFSGPVYVKDTLRLTQLQVNGIAVDMSKQHFVSKDKMLVMPQKYLSALQQNASVQSTMVGFFSKFGLGNLVTTWDADTLVNSSIFMVWYHQQLTAILDKKIDSIQMIEQQFVWNGAAVVPIGSPQKWNTFVYP